MSQELEGVKIINTGMHSPLAAQKYRGYPKSEDEAIVTCPMCQARIAPEKLLVDDVLRYRPQECVCMIEARKQEKERKARENYLNSGYQHLYQWVGTRWDDSPLRKKTFANFKASRQPRAYKLTQAFAAAPSGVLVLYGSFGTGKTHLLSAMCNEALEQHGIIGRFTSVSKLFSAIQVAIQYHEDYHAIIEKAVRTDLLVLDDIDKVKWTQFREDVYFEIMDARSIHERPTAISTNKLDELAEYVGQAVCSRLKIGQIALEMVGKDYREEI